MTSGVSQIKNKTFWVKSKWIMRATGWNKGEMRDARERGMVTWRHTEKDGFQYDINSIHHSMLINKQQ